MAKGLSPREAAYRTMEEVGAALVAIALVLTAVFVPSAFITGISGQFYRQFALTIAGATIISLIVSLTLSPALCALLLKPHSESHHTAWYMWPLEAFFRVFNWSFEKLSHGYVGSSGGWCARRHHARRLCRRHRLRHERVSQDPDRLHSGGRRRIPHHRHAASAGRFAGAHRRGEPEGSGAGAGNARCRARCEHRRVLRRNAHQRAECRRRVCSSEAVDERAKDPNQSAQAIQKALFGKFSTIQDASIFVVAPPPVRGIGSAGCFRMMVQDRGGAGPAALQQAVGAMMAKANQTPGLQQVFSMFENSTPQLYLDIDRVKAQMLGINVTDVFTALQTYLGSAYVNDFNLLGRTFRVTAQADSSFRVDNKDVLKLRVRNSSGDTVPLGSFTTVRDMLGPLARASLQPLSGSGARRLGRARLFARAGHRSDAEAGGRDAAAGLQLRMDRARLPADPGRQYRRFRLRPWRHIRLPRAGRAVREPDAAAGGDPHRADEPHRVDHRRRHARHGQQHPHAGRLHRAHRPGGEERHSDRRVRRAAGGRRAQQVRGGDAKPHACACGPS